MIERTMLLIPEVVIDLSYPCAEVIVVHPEAVVTADGWIVREIRQSIFADVVLRTIGVFRLEIAAHEEGTRRAAATTSLQIRALGFPAGLGNVAAATGER